MPKAKDLTGELGRLRKRGVLPRGTPPALPQPGVRERALAFNGTGALCWALVAVLLVAQGAFVFWLL